MRRPPSLAILVILFTVLAPRVFAADWTATSLPARQSKDAPAQGVRTPAEPVWYRCFIRVPVNMTSRAEPDLWSDSVILSLAGIDGPFTVYLNGRKIAEADALADEPRQRFKVPKGILERDVFNVLAIRLDARAAPGGIRHAPILAGYFDELLLQGAWEIRPGEIDPATLKPVPRQPPAAFYTEAGFRPSSTPLPATTQFMPGRRLDPDASVATMKPADDLRVELLLNEPIVTQPTHLSFDERGRMWVAQYRQYPYPAGLKMISRDKYYRARYDRIPPAPPSHDRGRDIISVHEDTNGDGQFDRHRVILDGLNMANAVLPGRGGIWVMHTPYLLFYPDADGDDVPDSDPEVRLAGFGLEDTHSIANGLVWGPDGWLYGAQGSTTTSRIVCPDVDPPDAPGVYFEGSMVWRYHPETKAYEIFAEGGGNTFSLEFDSEGRLFSGHNGGDTRGWHFVQGGLYLKQAPDIGKFGPPANPYSFGQLPIMKSANPIRRFTHSIIVFEGTALPALYAGRIFGADPLHRNVMVAQRYPIGATFETSDTGVALAGGDIAFRPVFLANAPDGAIYLADFYEEFIAHGQNYQGQLDPTTGRIYRLRGANSTLNADVNLAARTTAQLVETLAHPNRWHRQTAVRLLGERSDRTALPPLGGLLREPDTHPALEALWALHQMGALDDAASPAARDALRHPAAPVRAWAVRLLGDANQLPQPFADAIRELARTEADPEVRAQIASTARRLPVSQALPLIAVLLQRDADVDDPFIPLLCWWVIEVHCDQERDAVLALLDRPAAWQPAPVRQHILPRLMRRLATKGTRADLLACAQLLAAAPADAHRTQLIAGFEEAFKGRALPPLPTELADALAQSGLASPVLRVRLGEPAAIRDALALAADATARSEDRLTSISLFGEVEVPDAPPILLAIARADERAELRKAALTSLLLYQDDAIGAAVAEFYLDLPAEVRPAAQNLLTSRPAWSLRLLKLIRGGALKPSEISVDLAGRLRAQQDAEVVQLAEELFPDTPANPPAAGAARLAEVQRMQRIIAQSPGDPYSGEPIFMERCAPCHRLFHKGGQIGPDLTSYQRDDLGTMLTSIIDPSVEIREGFQNYVVRTTDRRILTGFLVESDSAILVLRASDGQDVRVPRDRIQKLTPSATSLMPEGLLDGLNDQQLRDLFAYLRIPQPITR